MLKFIIKRIAMLIPVMLLVSLAVFSMLHFTPGDPARIMMGEAAPEDAVEALRAEMGLDDPFVVQYARWLGNLVIHQDAGTSIRTNRPVTDEVFDRFPATLTLAITGVAVAVVVGIPVGIISATKPYSIFDNLSMSFTLLGVSMPNFWLGMLLIIFFALTMQDTIFQLPPGGLGTWQHLILPSITLGTASAAMIARMTRSSMLEVIGQDYIKTARAKGQVERVIITKHALKNALIPIITIVGLQFGILLGGAILTESVFNIPGVGRLMIESILNRDFPVVQGGVLFVALLFSLVNLAVDILYAFVDPRVKSQYK